MFTETTLVVLLDDDTLIIVSINDNLFSKECFKKHLHLFLLSVLVTTAGEETKSIVKCSGTAN